MILLVVLGCRDSGTTKVPKINGGGSLCGDGLVGEGEDCDGSDLRGSSCQSLGFESGQLVCGADCHFVTTLCANRCGNGVLDQGEACDGQLGLTPCENWGYPACTSTCKLDPTHCVTQPWESASPLETRGGPAALGDLAPKGPGDLVIAVPSLGRVEAFGWDMSTGFSLNSPSRKLAYQHVPLRTGVCDFNGDGLDDVSTINDDGLVDELRYTGSSYALSSIDAGCASAVFVGCGPRSASTNSIGRFGCGQLSAGEVTLPTPDAGAALFADLTHDGLADLAWADGTGVLHVAAGPDFNDDGGFTLPSLHPSALAAGDFDHDGDADLAAIVGDEVQLFENLGATGWALHGTFAAPQVTAIFARDFDLDGRVDLVFVASDVVAERNLGDWHFTAFAAGLSPSGGRLSVAAGDVDGDGDLDVAITNALQGDLTRTLVVRNRVR